MKKKSSIPILGKMLQKIAPRIGATILMEPEWGIVCQITFKSGKRKYSRYNSIDLNSLGASEIAKDKDYANFFMKSMGYSTIEGRSFFSPTWAKAIGSKRSIAHAYMYAKKLGFPVIVKPNSGSQGIGVALVYNKTQLTRALTVAFKNDKVVLVQRYMEGHDYRIVVLDDMVISAYERIPLSLIGDGRSSIKKLLHEKKKYFATIDRDIKIKESDSRIKDTLGKQGHTLMSVLSKGERAMLLTNANLSTGGDSIDVTKQIHKDFKKLAIDLTRDMGLRICGVDLIVKGDIGKKPGSYCVIEINSAPGLDHYVTTGKAQAKIVENLYLEVLKSMEK